MSPACPKLGNHACENTTEVSLPVALENINRTYLPIDINYIIGNIGIPLEMDSQRQSGHVPQN